MQPWVIWDLRPGSQPAHNTVVCSWELRMSCTPRTEIFQLYIVLLSLPEAFIPQRVSKNKLRHVKSSRSLSEQTLIQIRRHPVCQIERSSKLFKMEDFGREPEQGRYTRQKVGSWLQEYFPSGAPKGPSGRSNGWCWSGDFWLNGSRFNFLESWDCKRS